MIRFETSASTMSFAMYEMVKQLADKQGSEWVNRKSHQRSCHAWAFVSQSSHKRSVVDISSHSVVRHRVRVEWRQRRLLFWALRRFQNTQRDARHVSGLRDVIWWKILSESQSSLIRSVFGSGIKTILLPALNFHLVWGRMSASGRDLRWCRSRWVAGDVLCSEHELLIRQIVNIFRRVFRTFRTRVSNHLFLSSQYQYFETA